MPKLKLVHQFSLLAVVALLLIVGLALLDFHYKSTINTITREQERLLLIREQLAKVEREILRARLDESQMISSRKSSFFERFEQKVETIRSVLNTLTSQFQADAITEPQSIMLKTLNRYHKYVHKTLTLQKQMGLEGKQGLLVELIAIETALQNVLYTIDNKKLNLLFLQMQLLEKDFSNTLNMKLADKLLTLASTFSEELKTQNLSKTHQDNLPLYLTNYRDKVSQLMNKIVEIELSIATSTLQFEHMFPNLQKSQQRTNELIALTAEKLAEQLHVSEFQTIAIFSGAFIILAIFMFFQIRSAQTLVTRLHQLAICMRYVAAGDFEKSINLPQGQDEVGVLARTFSKMTSQIKSQMAVIENEHKMIQQEKDKSEKLLLNILPSAIAARLKQQETLIADKFENATVLFCDIVGFTTLSAAISPDEVVQTLNLIFTSFDALTTNYGLEKIKTIGDAYMVVGGVPNPCDNHAERIAQTALEMLKSVESLAKKIGQPLSIRVGIHSGEVIAGVIGTTKIAYDLWGDTVNTASRMESHGVPGKIHCSEETYQLLKAKFQLELRGNIEIKGKGNMRTYFLIQHN